MSNDLSNVQRVEHIKTELKLCFTFAALAASKYKSGDQDSAAQSLANAENLYAAVLPLV